MSGAPESATTPGAAEAPRPSARGHWTLSPRVPAAVLITSLVLTGIIVSGVARLLRSRDEARFENAVRDVEDRIRARLDAYVGALQGAAGLFAARHGEISREEFRAYVLRAELDRRYPGIEGIGFSKRLPASQRESFTQALRATGLADFAVWPKSPASEYFPIVYLEPPGRRNWAAMGFDMHSEPVRRAAMDRAWTTGAAALSGKVLLKQEIEQRKQAGFLLYVPVYRDGDVPSSERERAQALVGFVYAPFRADDFFAGIFGEEVRPRVAFSVYDGPRTEPDELLHDSRVRGLAAEAPHSTRTTRLSVGGRSWTLRSSSLPLVDRAIPDLLVPGLALSGVALSLLLFALARSLARARQESELRARETQEASKLLDSERARLSSLFMAAPASIAMTRGPEHVYVLSNPINDAWMGERPLLGKPVRAAYPEGGAGGFFALLDRVYETGEPYSATEAPMRVTRTDGSTEELFINFVYQPTRDGEGAVDGIAGFAFDVTAQVVARRRAEEAVQARDIFLTVASHELKTPLTALALRMSQLRRELDGLRTGTSRQLRHLDTAESQVKRLSELVDRLLDVSNLTEGKLSLSLKEADLTEIVRETVQVMRPQALKAGCEIRLELGESVYGLFDELRIAQVVINLLSNSIKFGAGHPIHVKICAVAGRVHLTVRDEGIGIASEDLGRIFTRFERAVSSRNYGGLGLGLWVTREIVEAMGGSVSASSAPGEGATFVVEIPPASAVPQA